jgi:hypothetical protein
VIEKNDASNYEILLYVIWKLGGAGSFVDIEAVYEEAWRFAPTRFGWRSRPYPSDYIGDRAFRALLRDDDLSRRIVVSPNRQALQLTAAGVAWVETNLERFNQSPEARGARARGRGAQRHLVALETREIVQAYANGENISVTRPKFADLLRLTPDADARAWRERLESYRSAAKQADRAVVLRFCDRLESEHPDWFDTPRGL